MKKEYINKIASRIKELTTEKSGYSHFEYYEIGDKGVYFDGDIDNLIFTALELVKKEFSLKIEIYIIANEDANDEQFYINFYEDLK